MAEALHGAAVAHLGHTLVLAPHPDDETLACGGLISLLARADVPVCVVLLTDGAASHPGSLAFAAPRLAALRHREMVAALMELGLAEPALVSLSWPDGGLPQRKDAGFDLALQQLWQVASVFKPATVILPSAHDLHADHRAAQALGAALCAELPTPPRQLAYTVWGDVPASGAWRVDISAVLDAKLRALACHRSQLGALVHDDPNGFTLPPHLVASCKLPVETFADLSHRGRDAHP